MTAFGQKLDNAAGAATCQALQTGGAALIGYGAVGLAAGGTGIVPLAAGSLALMASNLGCTWDPNQGTPQPPWPGELCYEGASTFIIQELQDGVFKGGSTPDIKRITEVRFDGNEICGTGGSRDGYTIFWVKEGGETGTTGLYGGGTCGGVTYSLKQVWNGDPTCEVPGPEPERPDIPPYEYTDPEDGCKLTVNLKGFQQDPTGGINPVFKIEPGVENRADGGVIGGCNFSPVIYTGGPPGGGQPPQYRPWNPDWDNPGGGLSPWQDFINDLAGSLISNLLYDALSDLYATPLGGANYKLLAPCEVDGDGNRLEVEVQIPELPTPIGIATRIEALIPILQGQKDFKQPTCDPIPVKLEGEFRTIGFISEKTSPYGKSRLRKRLRYRSLSGLGLDALIDYWKGFEFSAGSVIVKHRGARWGTITVWASSADEGKRVIRHAAGEALIDADKVGRWEISGSSSTRLGVSGTMKVNKAGGYYWITARDGSDNRPRVGTT